MNTLLYCVSISVVLHAKYISSSPSLPRSQNFVVAPGINYEYIYTKSTNNSGSNPTLLFLHGFPSSYHSWRHQIDYFTRQGYDTLAPNMMGYGRTYSPTNTSEYRSKAMVDHLITLLNHLKINKVIVIGHDWGTRAASRFVLHRPERTIGVTLISGSYNPPAILNLDQVLEVSKNALGYESYGHWKFFEANDAAKLIEDNLESFMDLVFASDPSLWKSNFAPVGKARQWLVNRNRTTRASYMTEHDYATLRQYFREGMQPKINWFKMMIANNDWNDEKDIDPIIKRPMLYLGGTQDAVSVIAAYGGPSKYVPDLETVPLNTGHWVMEEDPNAVNREIHRWIKRILQN